MPPLGIDPNTFCFLLTYMIDTITSLWQRNVYKADALPFELEGQKDF